MPVVLGRNPTIHNPQDLLPLLLWKTSRWWRSSC